MIAGMINGSVKRYLHDEVDSSIEKIKNMVAV